MGPSPVTVPQTAVVTESSAARSVKLALVGCGDVVTRRYLQALEHAAARMRLVACCDRDLARAGEVARLCEPWSPGVQVYDDVRALFADGETEAILNLTPPALHYEISLAALEAGVHVYSEKPLATTLEEADRLIDAAREIDRLLLCAPAVMSSPRFRWLREIVDSGRLGKPTLASGQIANLGPAAWPAYRSDPAPYYRAGLGPLFDEGVYLLHAVTGLLGPALRLQAMGAVAIPQRKALGGPQVGQTIPVKTNDQVLIQLEFRGSRLAQLLSSFAVPATRAPTFELHCTAGSVSMRNHLSAAGSVEVYVSDREPNGVRGWIENVQVAPEPPVVNDLVAGGALHFLACLLSEEPPILTAEHARHVLEIALGARTAQRSGQSVELSTTFRNEQTGRMQGRAAVVQGL